jgi:hypothetical protein
VVTCRATAGYEIEILDRQLSQCPALAQKLKSMKMNYTGALHLNRKFFLKIIKAENKQRSADSPTFWGSICPQMEKQK